MNRIKYENYLGAAGYDAVARRKIKELEKKLGPQMVEKVVFDSANVDLDFDQMNGYSVATVSNENIKIKSGKTYNVYLNGEVYTRTAFEAPLGGSNATFVFLGNAGLDSFYEGDTGEPFVVAIGSEFNAIAIASGYPMDIKISTMEEKASGGGMMRINVTASVDEYDNDVYSADKTYQEILDAIVAGILPYCVLGNGVYMLSVSEELSSIATYARAYCHHFARVDCLDGMPSIYSINIDAYDNVSANNILLAVAQG
jgi:hypothetical protein